MDAVSIYFCLRLSDETGKNQWSHRQKEEEPAYVKDAHTFIHKKKEVSDCS